MLKPRPVRAATSTPTNALSVGDRVVAIGLISRVHGIGKIAAIRTFKGVDLAAVKFASGHSDEFTELQLRKVSA